MQETHTTHVLYISQRNFKAGTIYKPNGNSQMPKTMQYFTLKCELKNDQPTTMLKPREITGRGRLEISK